MDYSSNGFAIGKVTSKQQKWAEADAMFLRKLSLNKNENEKEKKMKKDETLGYSSSVFGFEKYRSNDIINYSRQRYLRSYKFNDDHKEDDVDQVQKTSPFEKVINFFKLKSIAMPIK
ncbi:hypothetical protein Csa_006081 [Cucumis sativus]|uniref:Uncharacterized protein n=1 Tax=Cucumis sativus TaxID=3659 RepID=A0A0A0LJK1_CUCSA|nr:hypothetical protein Csa_006081 [Cucumis sativus]